LTDTIITNIQKYTVHLCKTSIETIQNKSFEPIWHVRIYKREKRDEMCYIKLRLLKKILCLILVQ